MYANINPSPPTGVGVNRIDGVKPSNKEVNEQAARGEFSQALTVQRQPAIKLDDTRAVREALSAQAQIATANAPFTSTQLLEYISTNQQKFESSAKNSSEESNTVSDTKTSSANVKKEKQAKQFLDIANFSSSKSLFEIVI